jgi:hypothetical protein
MPRYVDFAGNGIVAVTPVLTGYKFTQMTAAPAAVTDRFVTSTNMLVGAYSLANAGAMPTTGARHVTLTRTFATGADTPGTVTVTGLDLAGGVISETLIPSASDATLVTGTKWFASVTGVSGAGWTIAGGNDTIVVGCDASRVCASGPSGLLKSIIVNATAAGTVTVSDSTGTIAILPSNAVVGTYVYEVNWTNYLSVVQGAASNLTVVHSGSITV